MHLVEIPEKGYRKEIASSLEELKPEEFVFLAGLLYDLNQGKINASDLKTMFIYKLMDIGHDKKRYMSLEEEEKFRISENLFYISEHIDFIFHEDFQEGRPVLQFNFDFVHNPVPLIPRNIFAGILRPLHGPADALQDITFKQYVDAHAYFESYSNSQDLRSLDLLTAVLYRPKGQRYKLERIPSRAKRISRLPIGYRFGTYLFYVACEKFLKEGEVEFEGERISLKLLYESTIKERELASKQEYNMKASLMSIGFTLAETGIFGPLENVMQQNLYDILYLLYRQRISYLNQLENHD